MTKPKGTTMTPAEVARMSSELDRLGLQLAKREHNWSPDQRTAFQRAARACKAATDEPANLASPAFVESLADKYDTARTMLDEALALYTEGDATEFGDDDARARAGDSLTGVGIQTHGDPFKGDR